MRKSPFPGMDPWLERHWRDVHHSFLGYARDRLQERLPPDLRARLEERVFVEAEGELVRVLYPDMAVAERGGPEGPWRARDGGTASSDPIILEFSSEPASEGFIEIRDGASGNRVVTIIELLSRSNKVPGEAQDQYLQKQKEAREARVNLVEIDLLRAGNRVFAIPARRIPPSHRTTYQACVWRARRPLAFEIYRIPLPDSLPAIRIPLRDTDADVPLDLQAILDLCYRNGRYDDLDYRKDPDPPLSPSDAAWADALLKDRKLR